MKFVFNINQDDVKRIYATVDTVDFEKAFTTKKDSETTGIKAKLLGKQTGKEAESQKIDAAFDFEKKMECAYAAFEKKSFNTALANLHAAMKNVESLDSKWHKDNAHEMFKMYYIAALCVYNKYEGDLKDVPDSYYNYLEDATKYAELLDLDNLANAQKAWDVYTRLVWYLRASKDNKTIQYLIFLKKKELLESKFDISLALNAKITTAEKCTQNNYAYSTEKQSVSSMQSNAAMDDFFYMPIDGFFNTPYRESLFNDSGIVFVGTIQKGTIQLNQYVKVYFKNGLTLRTTVKGIERNGRLFDNANFGENVGILLGGVGFERFENAVALRA